MAVKMRLIMGLPIALIVVSGCGIDDRNQQFAQCKLQYDKETITKAMRECTYVWRHMVTNWLTIRIAVIQRSCVNALFQQMG
jgi:hypothetical protein